jgi:PTH1 family peptidyl-tRNA hydrolase
MYLVVGLGNPGEKYDKTRHNIGRDAVEAFRVAHQFPDWTVNGRARALTSKGVYGDTEVLLVLPETYMNDSGEAVVYVAKTKKQIANMLVLHDELDVALGRFKISTNKSAGGHRGILSIIAHIKTQEFARLRIGIAPVTAGGKVKKVLGEADVKKHVLTGFKPTERETALRVLDRCVAAIELTLEKGPVLAANDVNAWVA